MTKRTPLIDVQNVCKDFEGAGGARFRVLSDIHLQVCEGDFIALLGPSGSGKSTLLRIIAGLARPTEGQVLYRGQPFPEPTLV